VKAQCERELAKLEALIGKKEGELEGVAQQLSEARQQQAQLAAELQHKERRLQALYDKQGRSAQVGTSCVGLLQLAGAVTKEPGQFITFLS
jgi:septal ring factor EnvC (AmiA/AmiB activator)